MTAILLVSKVTLVLVIALCLDLALRRKAVLACAAMWNAAILSLALIPVAALILPGLRLPVIAGEAPRASAQWTATVPDPISVAENEPAKLADDHQQRAEVLSPAPIQTTWFVPSVGWSLAVLYFAGVCIGLMRFTVSLAAIRLLRSHSAPQSCPVWKSTLAHWTNRFQCGHVELRQSDLVQVPLMLGWLRPAIIIPRSMAAKADLDQCDAVLVHELAHVMRGDFAWQMLQRIVQTALWFHPLMWLAAWRMHFVRERACDEFSVHSLGGSQRYSEVLLEIAGRLTHRPSLGLALGVLRMPQIATRIEALAESAGNSRCTVPARGWWPALVMCVCVSAAVGSLRLVSAQRPEQRAAQSETTEAGDDDPTNAPDQRKDEPRKMQVSVVDADGKPLAGAKIHVSVWTKEPGDGNRDFVCDDKGKAKFGLPKQIQILRLWAFHRGHVAMFAQWWPEEESKPRAIPTEYTFRLEKGTKVGGIVSNEDGEPIVGAKVEARLVGLHGEGEDAELALRAIPNTWLAEGAGAIKTDAEGRWSLDNVPAADDTEVLVMLGHPDYISESTWGGLQKEQGVTTRSLREGSATIVMERGVLVNGVVTDQDKKPVAGAIVIQGVNPYFEWGSQEVRTDAEGKYRLPPQPVGPLVVTVVAEGWAPDQRKIDSAAANPTVNLQLKPGKTTQIRFVDDAGTAISEVSVVIDGWRGNRALYNAVHPNVLTTKIPNKADKNGVYQWTWSPGDVVPYKFYKEGYAEASLAAGEGEHLVKLRKE